MNDLWLKLWGFVYDKLLGALTQPPGGVGVVKELGSGYSVEEEREMNVEKLRQAGLAAVYNPEWAPGQPNPGDTHCNGGAAEIAGAMGCTELAGKMADDQIAAMEASADFREDSMERAVAHALKGGLAFATIVEHPHGHLAALQPEPMQKSDTWDGDLVCLIFNVGHENKPCKLSGGFLKAQRPLIRFFLYKPEDEA